MESTNYYDAFIEVAEDCPVKVAMVPPHKKSKKTTANLQYELLIRKPYQYTSDEVVFHVRVKKRELPRKARAAEREKFFAKERPCLRSSPLTRRYGWGVHCDSEGKVALYAVESKEYKQLARDKNLKHLKARRSTRR